MNQFKKSVRYLFLCLLSTAFMPGLFACMNSSMSLVSIVPSGTDTTVTLQICIAGGFGGATGDTRSFSVYFYNGQSNPVQSGLTVSSFSPNSVTGQVTGCQMPAEDIGPTSSPFNTLYAIAYLDPGFYGYQPCASTPFACTSSLANCGAPYVQCITFSATMNFVPDFACVYGLENLSCNCSTMGIALRNGIPTANWLAPLASQAGGNVHVSWQAASAQTEPGRYELLRAFGPHPFSTIATLETGSGNNSPSLSFLDNGSDLFGQVLYKVRYFDPSGQMMESPIGSILLPEYKQLSFLSLQPNPSKGELQAALFLPQEGQVNWQLLDVLGKQVASGSEQLGIGKQQLQFEFSSQPAGTYFLRVQQGEEIASRRVLIE